MKRFLFLLAVPLLAACTDVTVIGPDGHPVGTPTIEMPASMGVDAVGEIRGTDAAGFIHTVVGRSPHQTGDIAIIRFATPYRAAPFVIITGGSAGGVLVRAYAKSITREGFTVTTSAGYNGTSAILDYYYQVVPQ